MPAPRLLYNSKNKILSEELFSDLNVDKIFSENTLEILKCKCDKDEILRRQEVFSGLFDLNSYSKVEKCFDTLKRFSKSYELFKSSQAVPEKLYLNKKLLLNYADSCAALSGLDMEGTVFRSIYEYFSRPEVLSLCENIRKDMAEIQSVFENIDSFVITFSDKNWLTFDLVSRDSFDVITDYMKSMCFDTPEKRNVNLSFDSSLSDAFSKRFSNELKSIEDIFEKYESIDFSEIYSYIPEFEFYFEIYKLFKKAEVKRIPHCFPKLSENKICKADSLYDISLIVKNPDVIIPNDAYFTETEPFWFLTGANGGGKTTYLRAVGINLILFLSGCPIFAVSAEIYPFDKILSHFPKDERFDGVGRLDEEKLRAEDMFNMAENTVSFVLFNETFSGTDDVLGYRYLLEAAERMKNDRHFGVYVTHFHQVTGTDFPTLSAVVDKSDENRRTYKIMRNDISESSYAADILKKYRLDKESLKERLELNG